MLCLVHGDRAAIRDAGADAVGSLDGLRPQPAEPDALGAELRRTRLAAAVLDGDTLGVANL